MYLEFEWFSLEFNYITNSPCCYGLLCVGAQPGVMVANKLKEAIRSKCSVVEAEEILLDLQSPMSDPLGLCSLVMQQYFFESSPV